MKLVEVARGRHGLMALGKPAQNKKKPLIEISGLKLNPATFYSPIQLPA